MGALYDDLNGHEGYAARRLPDGTLTATWSPAHRRATRRPSTSGKDAMLSRYRPDGAEEDMIGEVGLAVSKLALDRPAVRTRVLDELATWVAATVERSRSESRAASTRAVLEAPTRQLKGRSLAL